MTCFAYCKDPISHFLSFLLRILSESLSSSLSLSHYYYDYHLHCVRWKEMQRAAFYMRVLIHEGNFSFVSSPHSVSQSVAYIHCDSFSNEKNLSNASSLSVCFAHVCVRVWLFVLIWNGEKSITHYNTRCIAYWIYIYKFC